MATNPTAAALPFRLWWGILACCLLMGVIAIVGPYSDDIEFILDQGASWYYWKLPVPDFWSRFTAWSGYLLHQFSMWALIYYGIHLKPRYQNTLHPFNVAAIAVNAFFIFLHIGQTKLFYDGLAQDVSVFSSFGSVVAMFTMVIIMENKRRGIFISKGANVLVPVGETLKRYHGYYFSWAVIYTFWFHPIEITLGHLAGTFYTIMLMLQGSLFFTSFHTNRWWTAFLEIFVAIHGAMVAYMMLGTDTGASPSIFLVAGLGGITLIQMWGVPLTTRQRQIIGLTFIISVGLYYAYLPDPPGKLPIMLTLRYAGIALIAFLLWLLFKTFGLLNRAKEPG